MAGVEEHPRLHSPQQASPSAEHVVQWLIAERSLKLNLGTILKGSVLNAALNALASSSQFGLP